MASTFSTDTDVQQGSPLQLDSPGDQADDHASPGIEAAPNPAVCCEVDALHLDDSPTADDDGPTTELRLIQVHAAASSTGAALADAFAFTNAEARPPICPCMPDAAAGGVGSPAREIAVGSVLRARYVLEQVIGQGGDSIVFRARDLHRASPEETSGSLVAVKVLRPQRRDNLNALTRLKREFRQMQCLTHPGIVRVFDLDCDGDIWFVTMELVAAQTLKTWMQTPASHAEALRIIGACCEALEYAHSLGILHGDLKPTNVLLVEDGTVKLIDFGSAPSPGSGDTAGADPSLAATPTYASPQILSGSNAERRDDIFSLACLSYSILSGGGHPFGHKSSLEACGAQLAPIYLPRIPARLFEVIERALSPERERRPASVGKFLRDLISTDLRRWTAPESAAAAPTRAGGGSVEPQSVATPSESGLPRIDALKRSGQNEGEAAKTPAMLLPALSYRYGRPRGSVRRPQRYRTLIVLAVVLLGAAAVFRQATHLNTARTEGLPPRAMAMGPDLMVATASADAVQPIGPPAVNSEVLPESRATPHESGFISFDEPTVHVSAAQSLVAISVKRLQSTRGSAAFAWRVERGTAQADVDYERVEPRVVRFIEGQTVRSLFIALIKNRTTLTARGPRTFTVALEKVAGGPALGPVARVTVTIEPPPLATRSAIYQARADEY